MKSLCGHVELQKISKASIRFIGRLTKVPFFGIFNCLNRRIRLSSSLVKGMRVRGSAVMLGSKRSAGVALRGQAEESIEHS